MTGAGAPPGDAAGAAGTVLVAGVSGVVGRAAAAHFAGRPGWTVLGISRRPPHDLPGVRHLPVDLTDREASRRALDGCGATHVVYAALHEEDDLVAGWHSRGQMAVNEAMLANLLDPLDRAGDLRHVTLLQGGKAYGMHLGPIAVPARERDPRVQHDNFYWLQEDLLRDRRAGRPWAFTILRPQIIFGESFGSNMNLVPALGVYGALLREQGQPLHFPGGAPSVFEATDAELLAAAMEWAATSERAGDATFNVTNGDVFVWQNVWPAVAAALGMEPGEERPLELAVEMPRRAQEWAAVVERHRLLAPVDLSAFVGRSFTYADRLLGFGRTEPDVKLMSTVAIRQAGFGLCTDTEDMLVRWFRRFQQRRLLPTP